VLYNELENWRQHETRRINEKERLEEQTKLLSKQTKLVQTIDRLHKEFLGLMSAPKQWQMSDGDVADTPKLKLKRLRKSIKNKLYL
jgi:hypothetical protein